MSTMTIINEQITEALEGFTTEPSDDETLNTMRNIVDAILIAAMDNGRINTYAFAVKANLEENTITIAGTCDLFTNEEDTTIKVVIDSSGIPQTD